MKTKQWIRCAEDTGSAVVSFCKRFNIDKKVSSAVLKVSAIGVYLADINGKKVGEQVLTPGFTSYTFRVQYQTYDVTELIEESNTLRVSVGNGWAVGHFRFSWDRYFADHTRAMAELEINYEDGSMENICTDDTWEVWTNPVTFAEIYDGETIDNTLIPEKIGNAVLDDDEYPVIPEEGDPIMEQEVLFATRLIVTPKGEKVLDFGQNMTGYVSLRIKGKRGERVVISHAEVLDKDGNFYNDNYRSAKNCLTFVLSGEEDYFKPQFSFQGFRYIRIDEYPDTDIDVSGFRAVVVHSEMKRVGNFVCGDAKINQLYHNVIWGQKSNYLDIPTDCPQRDERLGWTGDAQVFCRVAATNYDVRRFFHKWFGDIRAEQRADGAIFGTCPEISKRFNGLSRISAGWSDAVIIIPWIIYELYGDKKILEDNFEMMKNWIEYMHNTGDEEYLWLTGYHYGDWLAMDTGGNRFMGATSNDLIASAFFAYSTKLFVKSGEALGRDMSYYRDMYEKIVSAFRRYFMEDGFPKEEFPLTEILPSPKHPSSDVHRKGITQTSIILILHFGLCTEEERPALIEKLVQLIHDFGDRMSTGFIGTPYILHALSENGREDIAYKLLFNECNPSWLYSVNRGATTMWEHWNGIKEDGSFWSKDMNSFNHYAYGAVGDWLYGAIAGIRIDEAGYKRVTIAPKPDKRLGFVDCSIETPYGVLESNWYYKDERVCFEFSVPPKVSATIVPPNGSHYSVGSGRYNFTT